MSRTSRPPVILIPPVISGTPVVGGSPVIQPGVWSRPTGTRYTLLRGGTPVMTAVNLTEAEMEAYAYVAADMNVQLSVVERALVGGSVALSNSVQGFLAFAVALLSTTNTYTAAGNTPGIPVGSTSMSMGLVWRKITGTTTNAVNQNIVGRFSNNVSGFRLNTLDADGTTGRVRHISYAVSSTPATVFTSSAQGVATTPTQNLIQRSVLTLGGGTLRTYVNNSLIASIACTGYTAPGVGVPFVVNTLSGSTDEFELISISVADTYAMSAPDVASWDAQVTGNNSRIVPGASHHWEGADAGGTSWADLLGGIVLGRAGSPIVRSFTPVYQ